MIGHLDANNFYCEAERTLRPALRGVPLIVLSNNDGCCIARSDEARALGIKMGQPWHEIRHMEHTEGLVALSANFGLYGILSDRLASLAAGLGPQFEQYSIDECFISMDGMRCDLRARAIALRARILQWLGLPCCIGIGQTKTLAKLANHIAKQAERKPGSYPRELAQVCDLSKMSAHQVHELMGATAVDDVWGVGRRIGGQLRELGISTALDLARMPPAVARARWSLMLERTVRELGGVRCISLETAPPPRQQIACTRSFGHPVQELAPLVEAITAFATRACEKLRRQASCAGRVLVFVRTSPFRKTEQYSRAATIALPQPSADTHAIVGAAIRGLKEIYQPGFDMAKAGVLLLELQPMTREQFDLELPVEGEGRARLMKALDSVNDRFGRGSLQVASAGVEAQPKGWQMRQARRTPNYMSDWRELPLVRG